MYKVNEHDYQFAKSRIIDIKDTMKDIKKEIKSTLKDNNKAWVEKRVDYLNKTLQSGIDDIKFFESLISRYELQA